MHLQSAGFQDQVFNFARKKKTIGILHSRIASTSPAYFLVAFRVRDSGSKVKVCITNTIICSRYAEAKELKLTVHNTLSSFSWRSGRTDLTADQ